MDEDEQTLVAIMAAEKIERQLRWEKMNSQRDQFLGYGPPTIPMTPMGESAKQREINRLEQRCSDLMGRIHELEKVTRRLLDYEHYARNYGGAVRECMGEYPQHEEYPCLHCGTDWQKTKICLRKG